MIIKNDYIDKKDLREYISGYIKSCNGKPTYTDIDAMAGIVSLLEQMPAADVKPIKHGRWEEVTDYGGWGDTHYRCSVCGEEWYLEDGKPKDNNMNFCPRCGARMSED